MHRRRVVERGRLGERQVAQRVDEAQRRADQHRAAARVLRGELARAHNDEAAPRREPGEDRQRLDGPARPDEQRHRIARDRYLISGVQRREAEGRRADQQHRATAERARAPTSAGDPGQAGLAPGERWTSRIGARGGQQGRHRGIRVGASAAGVRAILLHRSVARGPARGEDRGGHRGRGRSRERRLRGNVRPGEAGKGVAVAGAGEGNRTLVVSLGSFCSAIELHPRGADSTPARPGPASRAGRRPGADC